MSAVTDVSPSSPPSPSNRLRLPFLPGLALAGFLTAVVAVGVIAWFSYNSLRETADLRGRVTHAVNVIDALQAVQTILVDAETGQRGFVITGDEAFLQPYQDAQVALPGTLATARGLVANDPDLRARFETMTTATARLLAILEETIALRRGRNADRADAIVSSGRGNALMDQLRGGISAMLEIERTSLQTMQSERDVAAAGSLRVTLLGTITLLVLIGIASLTMSRAFRQRETESWVRSGQAGLAALLQGEVRPDVLGERVLSYLANILEAPVGALYVVESGGGLRRVAGYALDTLQAAPAPEIVQGLHAQAVRERRTLVFDEVPAQHLPVVSALGRSTPRSIVIMPAAADGEVHGVVELGLFARLAAHERELLGRVSELVAIAIRTATDRARLEELLEETQQQSEELQAQQEELRVNNEELEEQSQVLKESQARLETQQAELEQTNTHLEEHAEEMRVQSEKLARAQVTLVEKAADLERANQYKSEFLANMSHELRTPLNSTLILAKLLADNKDGNLSSEQVRYAETISSAGNDLLALINDILDLAKVEAGKVELAIERIRVTSMVEAVARTFEPLAAEKGLALRVDIDRDTPERIETDPQRLGQILKNLLANAVKFTTTGSITVTVRPHGAEMTFVVRDTGIGIEADQQGVIFEAFRQADGSTHRKYGGTGLGLSISRDLARLLGGELRVASSPGQGSTFTLSLPVVYSPAASDPAAPPSSASPRMAALPPSPKAPAAKVPPAAPMGDDRDRLDASSRLLLIVEDDERFAAVLRDLAHEQGFQCLIALTAGDGLALAAQFMPHAILLDVNLPDHSGLGVLDQLKRSPKTRHIPVHMASVTDFSREAMELGAIGYALKPVKREELVEAFHRLDQKVSQGLRRVLIVEDEARQRESMTQLLAGPEVQITAVESATAALKALQAVTFDCMVMDLNLPDLSGYELLDAMAEQEAVSFPPVIVYTGRSLTRDEEQRLRRYSRSIIIKDARSPERLLDEVTLFLHQVEASLPPERQRMLKAARDRESALDGRRILVVEDDVRNVFALSSLLEPGGARVEIARNGREALEALERSQDRDETAIDLVLMDIMMPEMDGFTAMREIRKRPEWRKLPIIALTAKAMRDDQEKCLAAGANDYIAKPLDVEKLLSLIRVWMPK
jgi:signal transduction histidine kinase/DNA-binding response OmpR family regulator/CHASE3 domain sensor protein